MVTRIEEDTVHFGRIVGFNLRKNKMRTAFGDALYNVVEQWTLFFEAIRVRKAGILEKPSQRCRRVRENHGRRLVNRDGVDGFMQSKDFANVYRQTIR